MNNKCLYLRLRTKKGVRYMFCVRRKAEIERKDCFGCIYREYRKASKNTLKTRIKPISKNNKITKATSIPKKVKMKVWERDNHMCIFCNKPVEWNFANSHYIKRSHLGLGIEENIMTNCSSCHSLFEESDKRNEMKIFAREYFKSKYPYWNEEDLVYKKIG